jgi:LacI family transcriptional regulator, repressor for deo operon, udp, cdd, tsx, nupC, and nupG
MRPDGTEKTSRVSIADVARAAGVSTATVSKVLNKREGDVKISPRTRSRILEVVEQLGYQRNFLAATLRAERTGVIGAVSSNIGGLYMSQLAQYIRDAAHGKGIEVLFGAMRVDRDGIVGQIDLFQSQLFDGVLLLGSMPEYQEMIRNRRQPQKPSVSVAAPALAQSAVPVVLVDSRSVVHKALSYLVDQGHKRIGFVGSALWQNHRELSQIYKGFLAEHGLPSPADHLLLVEDFPYTPWHPDFAEASHETVARCVASVARLSSPPTALFCVNDGFAAAAVKGLNSAGLRVPGDISVMGYGDEIHSSLMSPALTTIRPPHKEMAEAAVNLLLDIIEHPDDKALRTRHVLLQPGIVVRESCAAPVIG